jgi:hypothetical protein
MRKILCIFAACVLSTTALAAEKKVWKDAPLAPDQSLPHGLVLLPGSHVVHDPDTPSPDRNKGFAIKVPSSSGHQDWWGDQYAMQLQALGWKHSAAIPPLQMLNRQKANCNEQMIIIALGPNTKDTGVLKGSDVPQFEFDLLAFNYSANGDCKSNR